MKAKGLFIIGTDTGVGKTLISSLLIRFFLNKGKRVVAMKPFESGLAQPSDTEILWAAQKGRKTASPPWQICPYRFSEPLAPAQAAKRSGMAIDLKRVGRAFSDLKSQGFVIVEGSGGLLVPILPKKPQFTVEDLVLDFQIPALIVSRAGLGTLNHTLLTLKRCEQVGIPVMGIVLNTVTPPKPKAGSFRHGARDLSVSLNASTLKSLTPLPIWGPLPFSAALGKHTRGQSIHNPKVFRDRETRKFLLEAYEILFSDRKRRVKP